MSSENTTFINQNNRKGRRKIVLFFLLGVTIFIGRYFIWYSIQKPALGVIKSGELPKEQESFTQKNEKKLYKGKYITFSYPGSYSEKSHELPENGPVREKIVFFGDEMEGKQIVVTVDERLEKSLDASPSFQMRIKNPKQYEKEMRGVGDEKKVLFTKNSQVFEVTAFFMKKNLLMSVSVTSSIHLDGLRDDLLEILQTL